MPLIYTIDGDLEELNITSPYNTDFIRKMLNMSDFFKQGALNELEIARKLMDHPLPNVVNVYHISHDPPYIDYELLDTDLLDTEEIIKSDQLISDIRKGLTQLHSLDIIYIDLKLDNFGYDKINNRFKIYDFDVSGITDKNKTKWIFKPVHYYNYKNVLKFCKEDENIFIKSLCKKKELTKFDEILFYKLFNEKLNLHSGGKIRIKKSKYYKKTIVNKDKRKRNKNRKHLTRKI